MPPLANPKLGPEGTLAAAQIEALERRLLDPAVRASAVAVGELLADDFLELGASGRSWKKAEVVAELAANPRVRGRLADFVLRPLGDEFALAIYRLEASDAAGAGSLRSSIWRRTPSGGWQLVFHQGTPTGAIP